jgi:hypothetical protein
MHKKLLLALSFFLFTIALFAQADTMYINGRFLYNNHNEQIILKGVNYSLLDDWNFPGNMNTGNERTSEIAKSKANAVRIQWYNNYGNAMRPAYALKDLDSVMSRCARNKMIPIPELHDVTCTNNYTNFTNQIVNWWTQPSVVALLNKHKRYAIVNLANEFGYYQWTGTPATALVTFKNNYKTAITALRTAGIKVPIMIDAPDCGTDADALIAAGTELINHDPLHNIMLSVHTYWQGYLGNNVASMNAKLTQMETSSLPFVLGEVANYQSDAMPCQYALNYQDILTTATAKNIGWLAWTWTNDYCSSRQMSSDGTYANLGTYGLDVVNNATYGLSATAVIQPLGFLPPPISLALLSAQLRATCINNNTKLVTTINNVFNGKLILQYYYNNTWHILSSENLNINNSNVSKFFSNTMGNKFRAVLQSANGATYYSNEVACEINTNPIFNIFPNPAKDKVQLLGNSFKYVNITHLNGKLLSTQAINNNVVNVYFLPAGVYMLKFYNTNNNNVAIKKLLKK